MLHEAFINSAKHISFKIFSTSETNLKLNIFLENCKWKINDNQKLVILLINSPEYSEMMGYSETNSLINSALVSITTIDHVFKNIHQDFALTTRVSNEFSR